uniref:Uncharacterized protein n=1 Tax=Timema monikensis TaxID=170555 RepID=A0A7R9DWS7_9NEOP|nr:unnamed protein product [Timema monikensis]
MNLLCGLNASCNVLISEPGSWETHLLLTRVVFRGRGRFWRGLLANQCIRLSVSVLPYMEGKRETRDRRDRPHGISETDPTVNHGGNNKASIKLVTGGLGPIKLVFANDGLLAQAGHGPNNSICRHPSRDGEMLQLKISNLRHKQVIWKWLDNYFIVHQT